MAFSDTLHGGPVAQSEIDRVRDTVLFEPPELKVRLVRFWVLLTLAAGISTYGLLSDSVATVIGAMIVAPLMLPIMGLAFGISIGDRSAILTSLLVSIGGISTAILVGYVFSMVMTASFDAESVGQIMVRTSPRLLDLLAALVTGLAGAFAIGRKDVSDTLPGVAIAISLVPPLANVGILLGEGRADLALGSFLLFATNYFAILLTGSLVFGLMGYPRVALAGESPRGRRLAILIVMAMLVLIALPLAYGSLKVYVKATAEHRVAQATETWLEGSGYQYVSTTADPGVDVEVVIAGDGDLPSEAALKDALAGELFGMPVKVEVVPARTIEIATE